MSRYYSILLSELAVELHKRAAQASGMSLSEHLRICLEADARAYGVELGLIGSTKDGDLLVSKSLAAPTFNAEPRPKVSQDILADLMGPQPVGKMRKVTRPR
jgi:hypothetical protein